MTNRKRYVLDHPRKLRMKCAGECAFCIRPIRKGEWVWSYRMSHRKIHQKCYSYQVDREREWKRTLLQSARLGF